MNTKFEFSPAELADLMTTQDLSDVIAEIDTLCFRLDFYEFDKWWDYRNARRKLTHPAVQSWMLRYGFSSFSDLSSAAIRVMCVSLKRYLAAIESGTAPKELPAKPTEVADA